MWEIDHIDSVPVGASINEAVELAKKYGNANDFAFVNGVLGAYVRGKGDDVPEAVKAEKDAETSAQEADEEQKKVEEYDAAAQAAKEEQ